MPVLTEHWRRTIYSIVLLLAAGSWPLAAAADNSAVRQLSPYTASYTTYGRGMKMTMNRELKTDGKGAYTLTNGGKLMVAGIHETGVFKVEGKTVLPQSYIYQGSGLYNRRREVRFTPGSDTIRSLYKDKWYDLPYSDGTLDRMSQQEQMRLILLNDFDPDEDIQFRVADGKRIKDRTLVFMGEETIDTPLGPVKTLHFNQPHDDPERKSDTWIAPDWDYLMVRTTHVEDGKLVEVVIASASINGKPVKAN